MRPLLALLPLLLALGAARGENVDLVTLPDRASVQLTIYNSEDLTLVKETRWLTLKRGSNRLQFSWANTLIDPTSVEFRPLERTGEIEVADTVFPGSKPQHLVWNIESRFEGQVRVEVSYFTSGLTWSMDYEATTDAAEERMDVQGFVRVYNASGEDYEGAEIRLIVGTINLVEKIADLARRQGIPMPAEPSPEFSKMRAEGAKAAFDQARDRMEERAIVKEGLSEYFMFSVEGRETVANGWSKRMRAVDAKEKPFAIVYRMREHQYGPRPVRFFVWTNDKAHGLGESPLPDGIVRVFRRDAGDALSFLGAQGVRYVPVDAPIEINLGPDDLVVHEAQRSATERFNFTFQHPHDRVAGWDERVKWVTTVRNYRERPIAFELQRVWEGDVEYASEMKTTLFDFRTIDARFEVAPRGSVPYPATVLVHQGANARQAQVLLK
jgi:hypothetical protein